MHKNKLQQGEIPLFNRYFILIWFSSLCLCLGQSMMNSTVILHMDSLGYSEDLAGLAGLPYAIFAILARFVGGDLCDKRGRRLVMVGACLLFAVSTWLFGCTSAFALLLLFRGIQGAGFSFGQTASSTVMVDVTPERKRQMGIGIFYVATAASFGFGSPIVLGLSKNGSYIPVILFAAAVLALGAVFALFCNYEKKPGFQPKKEEAADEARGLKRFFEPKALRGGIVMLFMSVGGISLSSFALLYAEKMEFSGASLFFTLAAVIMFVFNLGQAWILRHISAKLLLMLTFAFFGLAALLQALTHSNVTYFILGAAFGVLQGVCWPVGTSLAVDGVPYNRRGAANSTACLMTDIGAGVGTVAFGALFSAVGYTYTFYILAAILFVGVATAPLLFRSKGKKEPSDAA